MHSELEQHRRAKREAFVRKMTKASQGFGTAGSIAACSARRSGASHDPPARVGSSRRAVPSVEKDDITITTLWIRTLQLESRFRASTLAYA